MCGATAVSRVLVLRAGARMRLNADGISMCACSASIPFDCSITMRLSSACSRCSSRRRASVALAD